MLAVDPFLRGAAMGVLALLGAALWRSGPRSLLGILGLLNALCLCAYLLWAWPGSQELGRPVRQALAMLALMEPLLFWLLVNAVFVDGFRLRRWHLLLPVATVVPGALALLGKGSLPLPLLSACLWSVRLAAVAVVSHGLWLLYRDWRTDLLEPRRQVRWSLALVGVSLASLLAVGVALFAQAPTRPPALRTAEAAIFLGLALTLGWRALRPMPSTPLAAASPGSAAVPPPAPPDRLPPEDRLLSALAEGMAKGWWRRPGLGIGQLAELLAVPEYRLRRAINQGLGYRNFSAFLNDHRLPAAAAALLDTSHRLPVLTIALDHGFGSIGPFNRAFRDRYGMTPTEYRRQGGTGQPGGSAKAVA